MKRSVSALRIADFEPRRDARERTQQVVADEPGSRHLTMIHGSRESCPLGVSGTGLDRVEK